MNTTTTSIGLTRWHVTTTKDTPNPWCTAYRAWWKRTAFATWPTLSVSTLWTFPEALEHWTPCIFRHTRIATSLWTSGELSSPFRGLKETRKELTGDFFFSPSMMFNCENMSRVPQPGAPKVLKTVDELTANAGVRNIVTRNQMTDDIFDSDVSVCMEEVKGKEEDTEILNPWDGECTRFFNIFTIISSNFTRSCGHSPPFLAVFFAATQFADQSLKFSLHTL